jgi:glucose dehydrogenase
MSIQPGDTVELLMDIQSTNGIRSLNVGDQVVVHAVRHHVFSCLRDDGRELWLYQFCVRKKVTPNQVEIKFR